jgi:hypothetical protein
MSSMRKMTNTYECVKSAAMPRPAITSVSDLLLILAFSPWSIVFQHIQQTGHTATKDTSDMETVRELEKKKKGKKKR